MHVLQLRMLNLLLFFANCMHRKSGPGLGGPYLLPNMHALIYLCEHFNLHDQAAYWRAVLEMDAYQRRRLFEIVMSHIQSFKGKRAAVLGFAYKASTSDSRGSPSIDLVLSLLQEGASVYIYDPRVAAEDVMKACGYHRDVHVAGVIASEMPLDFIAAASVTLL